MSVHVKSKPKLTPKGHTKLTYKGTKVKPFQLKETGTISYGRPGKPNVAGIIGRAAARKESELAGQLVSKVAEDGSDVNALCEEYGLRREELGRITGFSLRALAEWASGKLPSQPAVRRLREVRRLLDALAQIVKRESIPAWLHKRNSAFDKLTPLQVIEVGEMDRLWATVHDLSSGQPA